MFSNNIISKSFFNVTSEIIYSWNSVEIILSSMKIKWNGLFLISWNKSFTICQDLYLILIEITGLSRYNVRCLHFLFYAHIIKLDFLMEEI